ncbi:hypothetical protein D3C72_1795100 [compost metagenome]
MADEKAAARQIGQRVAAVTAVKRVVAIARKGDATQYELGVGIDLRALELADPGRVVHQHAGVGGQDRRPCIGQAAAFMACLIQ